MLFKLKGFLKKIKQDDKSLASVQITLKKEGNIKKLLAALTDVNNLGRHNITELDLSGSRLTADNIKTLVSALNELPNIKTLGLDQCEIIDEHTSYLAKLKHVTTLSLKSNCLEEQPMFSRHLTALYLDDNPKISAKQVLLNLSIYAQNLKILSLNRCNVTDDALHYINKDGLKGLDKLYMRENSLSFNGIHDLQGFSLLTCLDLGQNKNITDHGVERISRFPLLKALFLDNCNLSFRGFDSILQMPKLATVDLSYNAGIKYSQWSEISGGQSILQNVKLNFCGLDDAHAEALVTLIPLLRNLEIANNAITKVGLCTLLDGLSLQTLVAHTQPLYRPARNKKEQAKEIEPLLTAISTASKLTAINLERTGLTAEMLLSLLPTAESPSKLKTLNGLSCQEQEVKLKAEIEGKNNPRITALESPRAAETSGSESVPSSKKLSKKDRRIQELELEVQQLKLQLQKAEQQLAKLNGVELVESGNSASVQQLVVQFGGAARNLGTHGHFAHKRTARTTAATPSATPSSDYNPFTS